MKILKTRNVITPSRAYGKPAGIDFYIPVLDDKIVEDIKQKNPLNVENQYFLITTNKNKHRFIILYPQARILIPSGIKVVLEEGTYLEAKNKSGIASSLGLVVGSSVVDEDYRGEIHISLINTGKTNVILNPNQKIVQFIQQKYEMNPIDEIDEEEFKSYGETERGEKGFGSSN